jgi:hypothetical protein
MKPEIKEYLTGLKEKFAETKYQGFIIKGSKIELLGTASTTSGIKQIIEEYLEGLDDIESKKTLHIATILYNIRLTKFVDGPLSVKCTIQPIIQGSKLSTRPKDIKSNTVHWTEDELESYKLKKGDYKLIIQGLLNGSIESNPYKTYTREDLE